LISGLFRFSPIDIEHQRRTSYCLSAAYNSMRAEQTETFSRAMSNTFTCGRLRWAHREYMSQRTDTTLPGVRIAVGLGFELRDKRRTHEKCFHTSKHQEGTAAIR
jgi:hypothetical protein